jgi:hypothetical protein
MPLYPCALVATAEQMTDPNQKEEINLVEAPGKTDEDRLEEERLHAWRLSQQHGAQVPDDA